MEDGMLATCSGSNSTSCWNVDYCKCQDRVRGSGIRADLIDLGICF
jgi:hypothetical protein